MTENQQRLFLLELQTTGNVTFACRAANVTRRQAYAERGSSPVFERLWRRMMGDARRDLDQRIADRAQAAA